MLKSLTLPDKVLFVLLVVSTVCSFLFISSMLPEGSQVIVEVGGAVIYRTDLGHDAEFSVHGTQGQIDLEVKDGAVRVVDAECPNKICVRTGSRRRTGDVIVCVPNKTIVRISGGKTIDVNAVTG